MRFDKLSITLSTPDNLSILFMRFHVDWYCRYDVEIAFNSLYEIPEKFLLMVMLSMI